MRKKVAILEIGGSHDECILSQMIGLKNAGSEIVFCGSREMLEKNSAFSRYIDEFREVILPGSMVGDFLAMVRLNKWFVRSKIDIVIANTAQGGHIRNLCLTAPQQVKFFGIIHTIKLLDNSFTQSLISKRIKNYFVLNDTLKQYATIKEGIIVRSFYPLSYPHFYEQVDKPSGEFWVAVIGGVEYRRKDLDGFVRMADSVPDYVHFYFLGKSNRNSGEVKRFLEQLEDRDLRDRVHLFDDFLSEEVFDAYLKQTEAIFPLVHPDTPSAEEYFTRQISGAVNVAFSYKIPLMIHEHYRDWEDFRHGTVLYTFENFREQFLRLMENHTELKNQLKSNLKFSSEFQNQQFAEVVLEAFQTLK